MAKSKSDYINKLYKRFKVQKEEISAPTPQMVMPGKWKVEQVQGQTAFVNLQDKHMVVPTIGMSQAEEKRLHEMGHVRFSFDKPIPDEYKGKVEFDSVQVVEDCRINSALARGKMPIPLSREDILLWRKFTKSEEATSRKVARLFVALSGRTSTSSVSSKYKDEIRKDCQEIVGESEFRLLEKMVSEVKHLGRTTWEQSRGTMARTYERDKKYYQGQIYSYARLIDSLFGADKTGDEQIENALKELLENTGETTLSRMNNWGEMEVVRHPMPIRSRGSLMLSDRTPTDMGLDMRYPHRAITDQMVFSRKKKTLGINILVDCSGSMGLSSEEIEKVLLLAPASLVATYNGESNYGKVNIIADKGRMVTKDVIRSKVHKYNGNVIDGPALEWLGEQHGPKIWVSDGYVTGIADDSAANLSAEAVAICRKHKILKINRLEELHSWLLLVKKGA